MKRSLRKGSFQSLISHSTNDSIGTTSKPEKLEEDYLQKQFKWEDEHMGNFRRIYPCSDSEKYEPFFKQTNISVYQDTAASRAREEASRIQKEENEVFLHFYKIYLMNEYWLLIYKKLSFDLQVKMKEQENKKISGKCSDSKLHSESPNTTQKNTITNDQEKSKSANISKKNTSVNVSVSE